MDISVPCHKSVINIDLTTIPIVFICPDSNEKYSRRKTHMFNLLNNLGFKNISMFKSSTDNYPLCLNKAFANVLKNYCDDSPVLILEDDVQITEWYHKYIEIPKETDAFYLGFSKSGGSLTENTHMGNCVIENINLDHIRIHNMLSGHAILYISKRYKEAVINVLESVNIPYYNDVLISRIQKNFNIYGYYYPLFYQSSLLDNSIHVENETKFNFQKKERVVVTAYYPLKKCKHNYDIYLSWANFFFKSVNCQTICFCPAEIAPYLQSIKNSNTILIVRPFNSFQMMNDTYMTIWNNFYEIDSEKDYHSPELYAIWAAKQEFVREAINIYKADIYIWCDIGCFRNIRNGSFKSVDKYVVSDKISCLSVHTDDGDTIGGGVLAGSKDAWHFFSKMYLDELLKNPHGKDQNVYKRIVNNENSTIINATNEFGDHWFHLTTLFSQ
jgi:hypothetical protein